MTILVTGAAGFIGSHVVDPLLVYGHTVVAVDSFSDYYNTAYKEENIRKHLHHPAYTLYRADITDRAALEKVFANHEIDWIIHLAAAAGVRASILHPLHYQKVNVEGTAQLLDLAVKHSITNLIFASSSSVYGNQEHVPFSEDANVDHPLSPYAATKKAAELLAYTYHHVYNLNCIGLRFFTVYGERGRPDMSPYLFADAMLHDKPIIRFGDGSMERDFTYIDDIVNGVTACIDKQFGYEIINLGNAHPITLNEYIATMERVTGVRARIEERPVQAGEMRRTCADISKAQRLLGWKPTTDLETGLTRFVDWFKTHRVQSSLHQ